MWAKGKKEQDKGLDSGRQGPSQWLAWVTQLAEVFLGGGMGEECDYHENPSQVEAKAMGRG